MILILISFIFLVLIGGLFGVIYEIVIKIKTFLLKLPIVPGVIILILSELGKFGKYLLRGVFWEKRGGHYKMKNS